MKAYFSTIVRLIAGVVIAWSVLWNLWNLNMSLGGFSPREDGGLVTFERLFVPIRFALFKDGYRDRNLGYVSARSVIGKPRDLRDDIRWSQLRYIAIPFILLPDPEGVPYLIGDYTGGDPIPERLEGFIKIYESEEGLVLYKGVAP